MLMTIGLVRLSLNWMDDWTNVVLSVLDLMLVSRRLNLGLLDFCLQDRLVFKLLLVHFDSWYECVVFNLAFWNLIISMWSCNNQFFIAWITYLPFYRLLIIWLINQFWMINFHTSCNKADYINSNSINYLPSFNLSGEMFSPT